VTGIIANVQQQQQQQQQQHVVISRELGSHGQTEDGERRHMPEGVCQSARFLLLTAVPAVSVTLKMYDRTGWKPHSYSDYDSGSESHPLMSSDASHTSRRSFG
jgi:hypothetical protein